MNDAIKKATEYCLNCRVKPCSIKGCPLNNNIPAFIKLVKEENKRKVYLITNNGKRKLELEKERMQKQIILFMKRDYEDEI